MQNIHAGARGPAVEDIQRRLTYLGYRLGETGVDGVYLADTVEGIRSFQGSLGLPQTGEVDAVTWSALVDSTFAFGDRMLYLRAPFFRGRDIEILQVALNSLGFTCGEVDGVFGTYTERAVIEFQRNMELDDDGVVGQDTFRELKQLKHMWEGKEVISHSAARALSTHRNKVLAHLGLVIRSADTDAFQVARRIKNLALASYDQVALRLAFTETEGYVGGTGQDPSIRPYLADITLIASSPQNTHDTVDGLIPSSGGTVVATGIHVVDVTGDQPALSAELESLVQADPAAPLVLKIATDRLDTTSRQGFQNVAVNILDAVCLAYGSIATTV